MKKTLRTAAIITDTPMSRSFQISKCRVCISMQRKTKLRTEHIFVRLPVSRLNVRYHISVITPISICMGAFFVSGCSIPLPNHIK